MKICDLTQFYSPLSGGVKRYVHEKIAYIENHSPGDEHILIVPGAKTERTVAGRSSVYSIHSPLLSRRSRYRALLNLRAVQEILEREKPDIIECSDPYQIAWKSIAVGAALRIPVLGFYHSHFPEAYLRNAARYLGRAVTRMVMNGAQRYVRKLYNRFEATLVPSEPLAQILTGWGVTNVRLVRLGVNTDVFKSTPDDRVATRATLGLADGAKLLLYVGRLSSDKNSRALFKAFDLLEERQPDQFHLLVVGDGSQRDGLIALRQKGARVSWIPYCTDSVELARYYRAADLFVHPGVQETFGLVALESQACGTPVVGIRGSHMDRVILHEQAGWASEDSVSALTGAIEDFGRVAPAISRESLSALAGREYSWARVFEQLFCIYREVRANYRTT